ncbi:MAG: hypothetical protein ACOYLX_10915 [Burkholderiaceae bacterium]
MRAAVLLVPDGSTGEPRLIAAWPPGGTPPRSIVEATIEVSRRAPVVHRPLDEREPAGPRLVAVRVEGGGQVRGWLAVMLDGDPARVERDAARWLSLGAAAGWPEPATGAAGERTAAPSGSADRTAHDPSVVASSRPVRAAAEAPTASAQTVGGALVIRRSLIHSRRIIQPVRRRQSALGDVSFKLGGVAVCLDVEGAAQGALITREVAACGLDPAHELVALGEHGFQQVVEIGGAGLSADLG